jgi:hypothetical protein
MAASRTLAIGRHGGGAAAVMSHARPSTIAYGIALSSTVTTRAKLF